MFPNDKGVHSLKKQTQITILNVYAPNNKVSNYTKEKLKEKKGKVDKI